MRVQRHGKRGRDARRTYMELVGMVAGLVVDPWVLGCGSNVVESGKGGSGRRCVGRGWSSRGSSEAREVHREVLVSFRVEFRDEVAL